MTMRECTQCGCEVARHVAANPCKACRIDNRRKARLLTAQRRAPLMRVGFTCIECGVVFYLSRQRASAGSNAGSAERACSVLCHNRFSNRLKRKPHPLRPMLSCVQCGVPFSKRYGRRFCSRLCGDMWSRQKLAEERRALREANLHRCPRCQKEFVPEHTTKQIYCSMRCANLSAPSHGTHQHRARMYGVEHQPVSRLSIFERDRWRCQLCGRHIRRWLNLPRHTHAPELDHIVPLSLGGPHRPSNLQTTCRDCNGKKAATILGQLRLA